MVKEPQAKDKADADLFIPSTYVAHDGRSHDAQRERGRYRMLAIDIDQGNPGKDTVVQAVRDVLGDVSMIVYSSSGATPDRLKWRVLLPLAASVSGEAYEEIQSAFFDLLRQHGLTPDGALARCGQPIYLPNVPMSKRGPDLKPLFYDHAVVRSNNVALTDGNPIMQEVERRGRESLWVNAASRRWIRRPCSTQPARLLTQLDRSLTGALLVLRSARSLECVNDAVHVVGAQGVPILPCDCSGGVMNVRLNAHSVLWIGTTCQKELHHR
jgi:hypothetical protein